MFKILTLWAVTFSPYTRDLTRQNITGHMSTIIIVIVIQQPSIRTVKAWTRF